MKPKGATIFSGGEGAGIGMSAAGVDMIWGLEKNARIAQHAETQVDHKIHCMDILNANPSNFPDIDFLHASPPCPSFSLAKADGGETSLDRSLAAKIVEFIEYFKPKIFTLENVYGYRKSESWRMIANCLNENYVFGWDVKHVNFADFGVPQTRKRMIVRAVQSQMFLPQYPKPERWVGWYESVEDIIDTFPESQFAPWQLDRLPEEISTIVMNSTDARESARHKPREANEPMNTVRTTTMYKSFLMNANNKESAVIRKIHESAATTRSSRTEKSRAWLSPGKVVAITPRGLARFQSFPDWYELPTKKTLATTIIGNSVPPLGMEKIYKQLVDIL